jgi:hypothetical protein
MSRKLFLIFTIALGAAIYFFWNTNYKRLLRSSVPENAKNIQIDSTAIDDIQDNIESIKAWSKRYVISPKVIMGVIIAERSLNKSSTNYFEEYYIRTTFLSKSEEYLKELVKATNEKIDNKLLKGESLQDFGFRLNHGLIWTIGLCQISILKGISIDSLMAGEEVRPVKSVKQIIIDLLTPDSNIKYTAYIVKKIQTDYKGLTDLDISADVPVLCTLYNTGKISESVLRFNKTHVKPQPNAFGQFVMYNDEKLDSILNISWH